MGDMKRILYPTYLLQFEIENVIQQRLFWTLPEANITPRKLGKAQSCVIEDKPKLKAKT